MTMPALRSLRLSNPGSKISLLAKPWVSPLFERDPNLDEIILYAREYESLSGKIRLVRELISRKFDSAVLFQNAFDAALITALSGIPQRIGYKRDGRGFLLTKAVPFDRYAGNLHHIQYYLHLLSAAGFPTKRSRPWIYLTLEERLWARDLLRDMARPVVGLNPGASYGSSKRWPARRFADVGNGVINEMNGSVVIFGSTAETPIAEEISRFISSAERSKKSVMAGRTSLRQLVSLVSECDVLVSNDSGPMHVGYAVGTPLVAIFGSTSPELTGPLGPGNVMIRKSVQCAPCFERECKGGDLKCMDLVSSEEVFDSVRKLAGRMRAVFFDRDGTLCRDAGYLNSMDMFEISPQIGELKRLKEKGFSLIGITNQSGISRGIVREGFVREVNDIFMRQYGFDGFYYCPHHPDEKCSCRKPEPGLLIDARNDFGIDLRKSFVIGDKESDVALAEAVGASGILLNGGTKTSTSNAFVTASDLREAVETVLSNAGAGSPLGRR